METIKLYFNLLLAQFMQSDPKDATKKKFQPTIIGWVILAVTGVIVLLFMFPKLYRKLFKRSAPRRRRSYQRKYSFARRGRSVGHGKGSLYMKRKMARLRNMRRRKSRHRA